MTKSTLEIAREALEIEIDGIKSVISRLDDNFELVVDLLYALRGRIIVTGVGKSGIIGRKIAATFTSTGSPAIFVHPLEGLHGDVGIVGRDDALIAISNSGETTEITSLAATVRKWGTKIVAITGNSASTLSRMALLTLDCRVDREACPLNMAPTASTTATLALGDALAVALMVRRGFNREDFLRSHPAGSLGERLNLKVKDMILDCLSVPQVPPTAKLDEIVESINDKNLGLTVVTQHNMVLGIITDGDLRRALANGTDLFEKEAHLLMTQNPLSIKSNRTAAEALEIMERKLITALVVTDDDGKKWLGIIHLHDLLGKGEIRFVS